MKAATGMIGSIGQAVERVTVIGRVKQHGVSSEAHEREKLECLCRTITRPAVSTQRLSLTAQGNIRYRLKTSYRDGTTDVVFEPLDFMARRPALVPTPPTNLKRYQRGLRAKHVRIQ